MFSWPLDLKDGLTTQSLNCRAVSLFSLCAFSAVLRLSIVLIEIDFSPFLSLCPLEFEILALHSWKILTLQTSVHVSNGPPYICTCFELFTSPQSLKEKGIKSLKGWWIHRCPPLQCPVFRGNWLNWGISLILLCSNHFHVTNGS